MIRSSAKQRSVKRLVAALLSCCLAISATGCAMCYTPYDDAYSAYGGVRERQDLFHGRVGSVLSDPAMQYAEPGGMSDQPTERDLYHYETPGAASDGVEEI